MNKIRIMLVDDQIILREGLKTIINLQEDMEVVAEADHGKMALDKLKSVKPDVILMDIRMPVLNGVEATTAIKKMYPDTSIIILTTFDDDDYIIDALSNGANGYLLKDIDAAQLVQSIRDSNRGQMMLPARIAIKLAARISNNQTMNTILERPIDLDKNPMFTIREKEISQLIVQGLGNREIARKLYLSEGTVKNYVSEIYNKIGTNNRTHACLLIQQILMDEKDN